MPDSLRPILVNGKPYRWRFDEVLVILPADRSGPQLYIEWGWQDWLEPGQVGHEPKVVTPRFVSEAIRAAVQLGWPDQNREPLRLYFRDGTFQKGTSSQ